MHTHAHTHAHTHTHTRTHTHAHAHTHAHTHTRTHTHTHMHMHTHTHLFNGPLSGTTWVSRYQKGKTNLDFTEARDSEWQWHQLGHMQVCTSLQTDNHTSIPPLSFLQAGCPSCRPANSIKALKAFLFTSCAISDHSSGNTNFTTLTIAKQQYATQRLKHKCSKVSLLGCKLRNSKIDWS